nr:MAG TPA: hypothetical protein [Caudoviricetes sp.]
MAINILDLHLIIPFLFHYLVQILKSDFVGRKLKQ